MILQILLIVFLASFAILNIYSKAYNNPYKLYFIFGKKGSGKSTLMTKIAIKYIKQGKKVYANYYIPNTYTYNPKDMSTFTFDSDSVVLLDEIGLEFNCRDWAKFPVGVREIFKLQRKYHFIMYCNSQSFDIDKQIRDLADQLYICKCYFNILSIARPIIKVQGVFNNEENGMGEIGEAYRYDFIFNSIFTFIPRYSVFFDSFSKPDRSSIPAQYQDWNNKQRYLKLRYVIWDSLKPKKRAKTKSRRSKKKLVRT